MRRHDSRRGAKVTGGAGLEGVEPRNIWSGVPTGLSLRQATVRIATWRGKKRGQIYFPGDRKLSGVKQGQTTFSSEPRLPQLT